MIESEEVNHSVQINVEVLEQVSSFKYLGTIINSRRNLDDEIN